MILYIYVSIYVGFAGNKQQLHRCFLAQGLGSDGSSNDDEDHEEDEDWWISPWETGDMIGCRDVRAGYKLPPMDGSRIISLRIVAQTLQVENGGNM